MPISEYISQEGRTKKVTWLDAPDLPPRELIATVCAICFTEDGQIVLVASSNRNWSIPGGPVEEKESIEETLVHQVLSEGCVTIQEYSYLGAQEIDDPTNPDGRTRYYHLRYWARVHLERFMPRLDIEYRTTVAPSGFLAAMKLPTMRVAEAILEAACKVNEQHVQRAQQDESVH